MSTLQAGLMGAVGGFALGWFFAFFIVWRDQRRRLDRLQIQTDALGRGRESR